MKLGDSVIYGAPAEPKGEGFIVGIVPAYVDPVQHPEKVEKSVLWTEDSRSLIGGAPRDHESYIVGISQGNHKDGTSKPLGLIWPKNKNIGVPENSTPKAEEIVKPPRQYVRKGK